MNSKNDRHLAISVRDLRKRYRQGFWGRGVEALRGISLSVNHGEIFGLLGPNGAGKTTLVKVLLGNIRKTDGGAMMLGYHAGDRRGRRRVGYLPEQLKISPHHTATTALEFYGRLSGMSRREIRSRTAEMLSLVGLAARDRESVKRFSKGMGQRLGLAQALLHKPDLVFLDEPTDGLDPVGRSQVRQILQSLRDQGCTIFLNSHLLQEVEFVCDRVAIMDAGQLKYVGTIDDLTPESQIRMVIECACEPSVAQTALVAFPHLDYSRSENTNDADPTRIQLSEGSQEKLDAVIDALRAKGISIHSVRQQRMTLEDAFLQLVSSGKEPECDPI